MSETMTVESNAKYCTHCGKAVLTRRGRPATELYDEDLFRKSNILKLLDCGECGLAADRYVECDGAQVRKYKKYNIFSLFLPSFPIIS